MTKYAWSACVLIYIAFLISLHHASIQSRQSSVQITLYMPELEEEEIETVIVKEFQDPVLKRCGCAG